MENQFDFNQLDSEDLVGFMAESIYETMFDQDKKIRKEVSRGIISQIYRYLEDRDSGEPIKKLYTMLVTTI